MKKKEIIINEKECKLGLDGKGDHLWSMNNFKELKRFTKFVCVSCKYQK